MYNGLFKLSESTAARRRLYFHCVDATDGITAETGEAGGQPQISKNGAAWGNTSATLTSIGNGRYYVELTAGELDTLGKILGRYKSANTAEALAQAEVVAFDPFSATDLGLSNLDATVSSRATQASLDTLDDYVDTEVAAIKAKTDNLPADPADASDIAASFASLNTKVDAIDDYIDTEVAAIKAKTDQLTFTTANRVDASILGLTAAAIDEIWDEVPAAELSVIPNTVASFRHMIQFLYQYFKLKRTVGSGVETMYKDNSTTPFGTATYSDDGTTFTKGKMS